MIVNWPEWHKIINDSFIPLVNNRDRILILKGGRGSSKSDFTAKKLIFRCLSENFFRCIVVRSQYNTLQASCYQNLKDLIIQLGLSELFTFRQQPLNIECINGNSFLFRGCDDTNTIKSVKDPTCIWWEEDIPTEDDWITVTTSVRTLKAEFIQEIFSINPEVEGNYQDHWFWKRFFEGQPENKTFSHSIKMEFEYDGKKESVDLKYTVHHSDHTHNKWLPLEYRARLIAEKEKNPYYYTIYTLGYWGNKQLGGRFYKCFDMGRNTKINRYDPETPLHLAFDFNVNPYMSCSVWQMNGDQIYQIDEIAMKSPDNTTSKTCKEFTRRYNSHTTGVFIYGDPAGRHEDTRSEAGFNDYSIIQRELERYNPIVRVASSAPPVHLRGQFINSVFESNFDGLSIWVLENSVYLKNDLLFGKEAADGTKLKEKVKIDGVTAEKHHHFCFVGETLVKTINGDKRIDTINAGDLVLTRSGYKRVLNVFDNGIKSVKTYDISGNKITATEGHKIWTKRFGFIPIKLLTISTIFCIFDENLNTWKKKLSSITVLDSCDTQTQKQEQSEFITQERLTEKQKDFMSINTSAKSVSLTQVWLYIMSMAIRLITIFQTLRLSARNFMQRNTQMKIKELKALNEILIYLQGQKHRNGISLKRGESGIKNTATIIKEMFWYFVLNAEVRLLGVLLGTKKQLGTTFRNTAPIDAGNGSQQEYLGQKERVYDIEVEDCHEYFANNILVSNSDGMDYFVCEARRSSFERYQHGDLSNYKRSYGRNEKNESKRL